MSTKPATLVKCDHSGCGRSLTAVSGDATKARGMVSKNGWVLKTSVFSGIKDYCPEHRADAGQADWMESIVDMLPKEGT